ncbi:MAG TPA: hypothetical protein VN838_31080, partial [Bradyrhizobium sp.]|nr:hypothetical protein [Bradyrhizobium sp.]
MARSVKLNNADEWTVVTTAAGPARRSSGRRAAVVSDTIPPEFLAPEVSVDQVMEVTPTSTRRAAGVPMVDVSVTPDAGETYALAIRHPSGALTFHAPDLEMGQRRGRSAAAVSFRFRVPLRGGQVVSERRGIVSSAVKVVLLKVGNKIVDALLPTLAAKTESALWKKAKLSEGWFKLDEASLRSGKL